MQIDIQNVSCVYHSGDKDEVRALDNVSLTIEAGSITGIIGHTGSGKSTLIQTLNGLIRPASGQIFAGETEVTAEDVSLIALRKKIGLVFQYPEHQLFEETVAEDVAFGPKNLGLDPEEIDERVKEAMNLVGLDYDRFADRSPFSLSGGQQRRAAIAGVLALRPDALILDEPAAGLDPVSRRGMMEFILDYHEKKQATVVLVSHNMEDVAEYCSHVCVLDHGRVLLDGTAREVFAQETLLREHGLELPAAGALVHRLREAGLPVRTEGVLTDEQAVDAVMEYLEKTTC